MLPKSARGFTLLEVLVACAIAIVLGVFLLGASTAVVHALTFQGIRLNEEANAGALTERWISDEDAAWAIFTPPNDVNGVPNADGHELDFFTRDAKNRSSFWAYTYDAPNKTLRRYLYASPGSAPVLDETFTAVTKFYAHTYPMTALQDQTSKIYSPLYAGASLADGAVQFYPSNAPWIKGGNQITYVRMETAVNVRELHLSTRTAPSGYIVILNYTPSPAPSGLQVWPPAVRYAKQGSQISAIMPPATIGSALNGLLGGGVARAAGGCTAVAYADTAFTQRIAPGTTDPWGAGAGVDVDGCYSGSIVVHEAGYHGAFNDGANDCNAALAPSGWTPTTAAGPTATQAFSGGATTTNGCSLSFADVSGKTGSAQAQVIDPCWIVAGSCTYSISYAAGPGASCDPVTGEFGSGYTGGGKAVMAPNSAGSWITSDGGATYSFTRATSGVVTVSVYSDYQIATATLQRTGGYHCSFSNSFPQTGGFTIGSV